MIYHTKNRSNDTTEIQKERKKEKTYFNAYFHYSQSKCQMWSLKKIALLKCDDALFLLFQEWIA